METYPVSRRLLRGKLIKVACDYRSVVQAENKPYTNMPMEKYINTEKNELLLDRNNNHKIH